MSYMDEQVRLYPELLRRLASGERLASRQDENEKLAATALVVEALENEKKASETSSEPKDGHQKEALIAEMGVGALLAHYGPKVVRKLRGEPEVPETAAELLKNFRRIIQEKEKAESAKRMAIATGLGGAAIGALAVKALDKGEKKAAEKVAEKDDECPPEKKDKKDKDDEKKDEKKKDAPPWVKDKKDKDEDEKNSSAKTASSRALLSRLLKNFR